MKALFLARHGQSVSNAVRRFQGVQDVALSELGQRQAAQLASALQRRSLAHVYASFPQAYVIVTGYYQIVSANSERTAAADRKSVV